MAILGLTHDEQGRVKQSLAITTKVAIGLGPDEGHNYPRKLDHFVFLRKEQIGSGNKAEIRWVPDDELTKHYGENCREVWITLIDDDLENVFPNEYAWWVKTQKLCWGDGKTATRRTKANLEGEPWPPEGRELPGCGRSCPDFVAGSCKPSADLYFWLADFPALGRACRIHTGGHRSIQQIYSALDQIQRITGGRLTGIRAKLVVRPEKSSFRDAKDGKRKGTTIWALSLELEKENVRAMIEQMTETALVFDRTRKLLGGHTVEYQVVEPEPDKAAEIAPEFAPENNEAVEAQAEVVEEISPEEAEQINQLKRVGKRLGYNQAQIDMLLGQHKGDYSKLITDLEELLQAGDGTTGCGEAAEPPSRETNPLREKPCKTTTPPRSKQSSSQSGKAQSRSFGF